MTENYILAYYQHIVDGRENVGKWIRLWYEKIVSGIERGDYFYDARKAGRAIRFIEGFCRHHEGKLAPQLIKLELWQKALVSVLFGIMDASGLRQFRECFVVIARKNGKTLLASAISAYMLYLDGEYGARVYFCAPKLQQASLCYNGLYQTITKDMELSAMAKKRRTDIYVAETNSSAEPLAFSAKKSDGLNPHLTVCDEIAAWAGDAGLKQYEVLKSALGSRTQPLILSISTAGYVNDGIYDELMKRSTSVLMGGSKETRLAPFLYMIDDPEKWNDINELKKSNPNLGVSTSVDYLLEEIAIAEASLSKASEFKIKYCNLKQNASVAWLSYADVQKCVRKEPLRIEDFRHTYAVAGIDLSKTTDLTSCCAIIERGGVLHVFSRFFLPRSRIEAATAEDQVPYDIFIKRGLLTVSGENEVDYHDVESWLTELRQKYEVMTMRIGYDRYCAAYLIQDLQKKGFICDDVFQGTNLTPMIWELESMIKDGKINIGDNSLLQSHLLNTALKSDETQRVKIVKIAKRAHIDGTAALLDALTMRQKYWNAIGGQLKNGSVR